LAAVRDTALVRLTGIPWTVWKTLTDTEPKHKKPSWLQVEIMHPTETAEAVAFHLFETGANSLVQDKHPDQGARMISRAGYEPHLDSDTVRNDLERRVEDVSRSFELDRMPDICWTYVEPGDWAEKWKEGLHPIEIGERLTIKPTWCDYPQQTGRIIISLDPGMAFGTGLHPTTRMCLEALEEMLRFTPDAYPDILDIGTGTGILAMAAAALGNGSVTAVDNDPEAVFVAADNLQLNNLAQRIDLAVGGPEILGKRFDLIMANLTANPLIQLASTMARLTKPGGKAVLSGILRHQVDDVFNEYRELGFRLAERRNDEEWSALILTGPDQGMESQ
jgi:ribosomal protein L11 methyltransferase